MPREAGRGRRDPVGDAAARFVGELAPWSWWGTLTFEGHVGDDRARRAVRQWLRMLARDVVGDHVPAVWAIEPQRRGVPHAHVLVALPMETEPAINALGWAEGPIAEPERLFYSLWRRSDAHAGITHFAPYRADGGAHRYVIKGGEWEACIVCPRRPVCRRRRGCIVAPAGW